MNYLLDRLKEASTWRGLVLILTSVGIGIHPELVTPIIAVGTGVAGAIGVALKDKK
jgi:hypothetical protein